MGRGRLEADTDRPERERVLASVLDTVPALVLVFDSKGEISFVNRACAQATGGCVLLLPHDNGDTRVAFEKMRNGELPSPFQSSSVLTDGTTRIIEWTYQRFTDAHGALHHIACTGVDVTDRERTQEALHTQVHFLQTLIDTIPNPLFFKTVEGLYRGCNRAFEEMLGIRREKLIGKSVYDLSPKPLADIYFRKDKELFDHPGLQVYEASVRFANGQIREVIYYKATYNDQYGQLAGLVGIVLDISLRKQAERELQVARDELELRVKERTAELEGLKNRAEDADRAKSDFLNIASHELRTPLTSLRLTVHQLRRDTLQGKAIGELHLARIDRQLARLTRMVNDLMDVSRLDRGVVVIQPRRIDLAALVADTVEEFRLVAPSRKLDAQVPAESVQIEADPDRIRQVLANFLDNALKYTPPDAPVKVELEKLDGRARLTVTDRGPGIPECERELLFTRFFRAQSPLHQEGLGLGLYISQEIIHRHAGVIGVEGAEGGGSTFFFELPLVGD